MVNNTFPIGNLEEWQKIDRNAGDDYLRQLKQKGLSVRQIARLKGIYRGVVLKT